MADMNKAEKLAAARRKLKEFQQKTKENSAGIKSSNIKHEDITKNTVDMNSTRDYVFDSGPHKKEGPQDLPSTNARSEQVQLSYEISEPVSTAPNTFSFDPGSHQQPMPSTNLNSGYDSLFGSSKQDFFDNFQSQQSYESIQNSQDSSVSQYSLNTTTVTSPSVTEWNVTGVATAPTQVSALITTGTVAPLPATECITTWTVGPLLSSESVTPRTVLKPTMTPSNGNDTFHAPPPDPTQSNLEPCESLEGENKPVPVVPSSSQILEDSESEPVSARSTSERIRQLSYQMNGLIAEAAPTTEVGESSELERRNQELAALLDIEKQSTEQLRLQLKEYQSHVSKLSSQLETVRTETESRLGNDLSSLQEQLKVHVQTIGILVAEKTELQSALSHCQAEVKLKVSEGEDLQGRLKARRYRVTELEKELTALRTSLESSEASRKLAAKELEHIRHQQTETKAQEQQLEEEHSELSHRLASKTEECVALNNELHETRTRLSLAQLRLTQLSSDDGVSATAQMEALHQAKISVEQRVVELENALKKSDAEHDRSNQQFQQYVRGVQSQLTELTLKVEELEAEKKTLTQREQSLISHVAELEKRLQEQKKPESLPTPDKNLQVRLSQLEDEKQALNKELSNVMNHLKNLEDTVQSKESRIEELESMVNHLQGEQPDQSRLLAAMESDKVAAARAVSQNQRLKVELQELQDGFVKLSDCKLDLTDKLEHERHRCRQLEEQITHLRTQMSEQQQASVTHDNGPSNQHQMAMATEQLLALSKENVELQNMVDQLRVSLDGVTEDLDNYESDVLTSLNEALQEVEAERDQLKCQLSKFEASPTDKTTSVTSGVTQEAMDQLQERFTKKMAEIAELSDEKQRLEHLVLQLQGETETIGEYIALYQKQRCLLRQRAEEKENQLKCLAQDREEMRLKLAQLNSLINRLVAEKVPEDNIPGPDSAIESQAEITNGELMEIKKQVSEKFSIPEKSDSETTPQAKEKGDTAGKILALLSEIGTSNLVDPHHPVEHFHPCAWCSGRLITV